MRSRSIPAPARLAALAIPAVLVVTSLSPVSAQDDSTLSIAFASDVSTFDPAIGYDALAFPVEHALYDTLVTYDDGTTLVPGLAVTMPTISEDGLTYTFDIRSDVPFVRKGEIVTPGQHIAAALRVPTLTIFVNSSSPTFAERWRPYGPGVIEVLNVK